MLKFLLVMCIAFTSFQFSNFVEAKGGGTPQPTPKEFSELSVSKGDSVVLPSYYGSTQWKIWNPNGITNVNKKFEFLGYCRVITGGGFTVIAVDGEEVLLRYSVSSKQKDEHCPSGTLFFENKSTINRIRWKSSMEKERDTEKEKSRQKIEQLIKSS